MKLKGERSLHPGGYPFDAIITKSPYINLNSTYKDYESLASEAGEPTYRILEELKMFDQSKFEDCVHYIMMQNIDAVKYVGSQSLFPKEIYELKNNELFKVL